MGCDFVVGLGLELPEEDELAPLEFKPNSVLNIEPSPGEMGEEEVML